MAVVPRPQLSGGHFREARPAARAYVGDENHLGKATSHRCPLRFRNGINSEGYRETCPRLDELASRRSSRSIRQGPLQRLRLVDRAGEPNIPLLRSSQKHVHRLGVDRRHDVVRVRRQKQNSQFRPWKADDIASAGPRAKSRAGDENAMRKPACCSHAGRSHEGPRLLRAKIKATLRQLS